MTDADRATLEARCDVVAREMVRTFAAKDGRAYEALRRERIGIERQLYGLGETEIARRVLQAHDEETTRERTRLMIRSEFGLLDPALAGRSNEQIEPQKSPNPVDPPKSVAAPADAPAKASSSHLAEVRIRRRPRPKAA